MKQTIYLLFFLLTLVSQPAWSQCVPASPSCSGCSALTSSNQNLSAGTWCITTAISNLTIQPGAVVCISAPGSLANANLNGGTLIYNGGTVTNFNANSGDFRVHGALSNPVNTSFNGARLIVENGGILNMTNLTVNGSLVVDGGTINVTNLFSINGGGSVCMANMGMIHTQYLQNNASNGTTAQSTKGCISVAQPQNGQTFLNNSLTSSANVLVCLPGTFTPSNLGSATVSTNCVGCSSALPVTYAYFRAQPHEKGVALEWQTSNDLRHSHFVVERSEDVMAFLPISGPVIDPFRVKNGNKTYQFLDRTVPADVYYYRLKQIDTDGQVTYSKVIGIHLNNANPVFKLYPNPVIDHLGISLETAETGIIDLELLDMNGKHLVSQSDLKIEKSFARTLPMRQLPTGEYLLTIRLGNQYYIRKIAKHN